MMIPLVSFTGTFQFLLGTLKTDATEDTDTATDPFQFLLGTLKTTVPPTSRGKEMEVSIPLRYAKNDGTIPTGWADRYRFQFLLGTLKTTGLIAAWYERKLFQFLLGTLKTEEAFYLVDLLFQFQFLLGTLKTKSAP